MEYWIPSPQFTWNVIHKLTHGLITVAFKIVMPGSPPRYVKRESLGLGSQSCVSHSSQDNSFFFFPKTILMLPSLQESTDVSLGTSHVFWLFVTQQCYYIHFIDCLLCQAHTTWFKITWRTMTSNLLKVNHSIVFRPLINQHFLALSAF